jgi:hypothetical protein
MDFVALFFSVVFIGYGILALFFKEAAWNFHKTSNDIAGRESKRTEAWGCGQIIVGIISMLIGIALALYGFTYSS